MVNLEQTDNGVILPVRAHAGARRNGVGGVHDGALKVAVTQAAEKGKANKAILETLCRALALRRSQVELIRGMTSSEKQFRVRDVTVAELRQKITAALQE